MTYHFFTSSQREMAVLLVVVSVLLLLVLLLKHCYSRPPNFPPGPPSIPIWGGYVQTLLENYNYPFRALHNMTKRYKSKIIGMHFGSVPLVYITDYDTIKEVLVRPEFQGRITNITTKHRSFGRDTGVIFTEGEDWVEQRRFALRHMRDFGFGRRSEKMENLFLREITNVIDIMHGAVKDKEVSCNAAVLLPYILVPPFINALMLVYAGEGFERAWDPVLREVSRRGFQFLKSGDASGGFLTLHSWLSWMFPKRSGFQDATIGSSHMKNFLKKILVEHKSTYSDETVRDFFDTFMKEKKFKTDHLLADEKLMITALDFLLPSATVMSATLQFAILHMMFHPEARRKVQEELDVVVGRDRLPTLDARPSLPYTEAAIRESMRFHTLTPISIPHKATQDAYLKGYFIPKNSAVITSLYSMHKDEELWGDPENYRPERFLDEDGKLKKQDFSLPFGAGKRLCAGETFARQNLFLFFAALFQNFNFELADESKHVTIKDNIPGIIETLPDFWVIPIPRM